MVMGQRSGYRDSIGYMRNCVYACGVPKLRSRPYKNPTKACNATITELMHGETSMWVVVKIKVPFSGTLNIRCRIILGIQ